MDIKLSENKMSNEMRQVDLIQACLDVVLGDVCGKKWALLDFPSHANVGDSAIWIGTRRILQKRFGSLPALVTRNKMFPRCMNECVSDGPIALLGGGNFGDIWDGYWQNRVNVLRQFPNRKIIQMPQSIHFENIAGSALIQTQRAIASHRDFTLLVRDRVSFDFSQKYFDCPIYQCPDMAYGMAGLSEVNAPSCDILALLRSDIEKNAAVDVSFAREMGVEISDWFSSDEKSSPKYRVQKKISHAFERLGKFGMASLERNFASQADYQVSRGIEILSRGKAVITDRLHGHILCSLMGKPHVVLDNVYGKIGNYLEAFPVDGMTLRANSIKEALALAREINT